MKPIIKDALFCCFLGMFGVHKFRKKQIFAGIVYAMTLGLFGLGWIRDSIHSLMLVADFHNSPYPHDSDIPNTVDVDSFLTPRSKKALTIIDLILNSLAATIVFILSCITLPSAGSILGLLALGLLLPIPKWQEWLNKFSKADLRRIIATLLAITMLVIGSPTSDSDYTPAVSTATTTSIAPVTTSTRNTTTTTATTTTTTIHMHDFADATCESPKTCLTCGATEGYADGHRYAGESCSVCGASNPNYVTELMVWIPSSGQKYHSRAGCSNMKNPTQVPISRALELGYEPCSKC